MSTLTYTTVIAALGAGLMGGYFFAFSNLVMPSLARLAPEAGVTAMQTIDVVVYNPAFFLAFLGTGALSLVLAVIAVMNLGNPGTMAMLAGSVIYLAGVIGVTMFFNVPMNEALKVMNPASAEAAAYWTEYLSRWTMWNHVRSAGGFLASGALILALRAA